MGDMNAHIKATDLDYIENDMNDILDDFLPHNYIADAIQKRCSTEVCQNTNEYGKQVLELCSEAQLRILNGRTIGDSKGKITLFTYNGTAITDYCICNVNLLSNIINFTVDSFDPVLSDHCPISMRLFSKSTTDSSSGLLKPKRKYVIWNEKKELIFKRNIESLDFEHVSKEVEEMLELVINEQKVISNDFIDTAVSKLSMLLYNAATNSGNSDPELRNVVKLRRKKKK